MVLALLVLVAANAAVVPVRLSLGRQRASREPEGVCADRDQFFRGAELLHKLRGGDVDSDTVNGKLLSATDAAPTNPPRALAKPSFRALKTLAMLSVILVIGKLGSMHYGVLTTLGLPSHPILLVLHNGLLLLLVEANVRSYLGVSLTGRRLPARFPLPEERADDDNAVGDAEEDTDCNHDAGDEAHEDAPSDSPRSPGVGK